VSTQRGPLSTTPAAEHSGAPSGVVAQVLEQGHVWLRFSAALEAQFQADTLEPRRKMLMICGLIGIVSICLGSAKVGDLMPDIAAVAYRNVVGILVISLLAVATFWIIPKHWRRTWQAEFATAVPLLSVNAGLIYGCMISRADTTFTHAAALVSAVMYACIAARLRFVWSLGCALMTFVGYVALARPHTALQALIVESTTALMAVSYVFVLVANYAFEYSERRNWLLRKLAAEQRDALTETSVRLHRMSIQDPLTGLFNRRQFDVELAQAWAKAQVAGDALALLAIDVDFFKRYNDTYGHPAGDACLFRVAQALSTVAQARGGVAARLGGEEFALLLPACSADEARQAGEAVCEAVQQAGMAHRASSVSSQVTVSVGVAQLWPARVGVAYMLEDMADQALYRAKEDGRHRVCVANADEASRAMAKIPAGAGVLAGAAIGAASPAAESVYIQILKGGFRKLRFPAELELAFQGRNVDERRKRLVFMAVLGLIINNIYVLGSRAMFPDIQHSALLWQTGLSALMLFMTALAYGRRMSVLQREGLYSLGTSILAVVSAWLLSQSHQMTALAQLVSLVLIPMFAGVGARQSFRFTCVPSVITCVAVIMLLRPVGAQQVLVFTDSLLMIVTNTAFTLILAYTLEYGARKEWLLSQIERVQADELQAATRRLHDLSMRDPLTGICNRRQFEEDFQHIWSDSVQGGQPVAMLMIDVDFFKNYNDGYGHPSGDLCLKQVATIISQVAQDSLGLSARMGGEEFAILLPRANAAQAAQLGERVCEAVRQAGIEHRYTQVPGLTVVTVSVGVACLSASVCMAPSTLFSLADDALYQAKTGGRNRAVIGGAGVQSAPAMSPMVEPSQASGVIAG
jgi:diguanylate cyclase (GGDEF)-like protein